MNVRSGAAEAVASGREMASFCQRNEKITAVPVTLEGDGIQDRIGGCPLPGSFAYFTERANREQSVKEGLFLHTCVPSARSKEVRLRRPLIALSTCSCRVSDGWEELANRAWPRRMASESRARPCQTSKACCST